MSQQKDLLVEIGTEELPPKALKHLSAAFTQGMVEALDKAQLSYTEAKSFAAPRRLAVFIKQLQTAQQDKEVQRRGPAVQAAFDDKGQATKAAEGFARSCGVSVDDLEQLKTKQGSWLVFNTTQKGQAAAELLPQMVRDALDKLPIPKRMRWGNLPSQFVRPVHWAVLLLGDEVVDTEILSVRSGRHTRGHRFHAPQQIELKTPADYESILLEQGKVIADFEQRRDKIRQQVQAAAQQAGGKAVIDEDLLDEVNSMVEWPVPVLGNFESHFLNVPQEALISTMKTNQKYFYMVDDNDKLMAHFITVSNVDSKDLDKVREGNERVVRPRFDDANFFWKQDRKNSLESHLESLKKVVFQNKLGTVYDKVQRTVNLAAFIAAELQSDVQLAQRAALLSKCDLMTEMVGEFPNLQGIMGRYYAEHDKEPVEVARALDELYMPRFAGDDTPKSKTGRVLAMADKVDTLMGIFGIGEIPTGVKDPFALRRAALGLLRIIIENRLALNLNDVLEFSANQFGSVIKELDQEALVKQVYDYVMERLRAYYQEQAVPSEVFDAVLSLKPQQPLDFDKRVHAVNEFRHLPEAQSLAAANKRIANILKKADQEADREVEQSLLAEDAEKVLAEKLLSVNYEVTPMFAQGDYQQALSKLAKLKEPVDAFFDQVMVMADDEKLKQNRIALLGSLRNLFLQVADLSCLQNS